MRAVGRGAARSPGCGRSSGARQPAVDGIGRRAGDRTTARLAQNFTLSSPASIAPMRSISALSTTSMIAIEIVSEARAIGTTAPNAMPERSSGRLVSV